MPELTGFGYGSTGHPCQFFIHPEIILDGYSGKCLVLIPYPDTFPGLYCLVKAFAIPSSRHKPSGELIHYDYLPVLKHIVYVLFEKIPGLKRLVECMYDAEVLGAVQVVQAGHLLYLFHAFLGYGYSPGFFIYVKIYILLQPGHQAGELLVKFSSAAGDPGDYEGGPGFIDQDAVHLVYYGERVPLLDHVIFAQHHIVPEIIKAELIIGAMDHITQVLLFLISLVHAVLQQSHLQPQKSIDRTHPLAVPFGQVVIYRYHMGAFTHDGIQIYRKGGCKGLSFTGLHLGYLSFEEYCPSHYLDIKMPHIDNAPGSFPDHGKCFRHKVFRTLSVFEPFFKLRRFFRELAVR